MRTTVIIDDALLKRARELSGIQETTALVRAGLDALIARDTSVWIGHFLGQGLGHLLGDGSVLMHRLFRTNWFTAISNNVKVFSAI